jgi:hypothetical protein
MQFFMWTPKKNMKKFPKRFLRSRGSRGYIWDPTEPQQNPIMALGKRPEKTKLRGITITTTTIATTTTKTTTTTTTTTTTLYI